jgi:CBS domain-containing protein
MHAGDVMKEAITITPRSTLAGARDAMLRYSVSRVVIAQAGRPVGMLTEKDIARFLYRETPARRLGEITVGEVMTQNPVTVQEDMDLKDCARLMLEKGISSLPVVDSKKNLKGIFTKSHLADVYAGHFAGKHLVREFMTKKVFTMFPDEPIHIALLLMNSHRVSRIVVTRHGKVVGIITSRDLLPVGAVFGTGTVGRYWTTRHDMVAKKRQQWYIPSGVKEVFVASDVMTRDPITVTPGSDLADAARIMVGNRISGLPVASESGRLEGIITKTDVVRALALNGRGT